MALVAEQKKRILVVDDSHFLVTILASTLRNAGYLVDEASDVKEAVFALKEKGPPDLLVMDLNLPDLRGDEAVKALRRAPACQRLPVIFISGLSEQALADVTRAAGGNGYLKKPFSPSSILKWIRDNAELLDIMAVERARAARPVVAGSMQVENAAESPRQPAAAAAPPRSPAPPTPEPAPAPAPAPAAAPAPEPELVAPATPKVLEPGLEEAGIEGVPKDGCILVIDDSSFLRSVLKDTLAGAGYAIALTADWGNGARVLKRVRPGLVFLDVGLPDMQGDDACAILKHSAEGKDLPVFLISSGSDAVLQAKVEASGADGYLRKPFTPVHILNWLRENDFPPPGEGGTVNAKPSLLDRVKERESAAETTLPPAGPERDTAIAVLSGQLLNPDPALRAQAAYLLGQAGHVESLPQIRSFLMDGDVGVVADCLYAVGEMRDKGSIEDIERLLRNTTRKVSQDLNVRMRAIEALGKIGDPKAIKVIALCLEADRPRDERLVAVQALADLGDLGVQGDLQRLMFEDDGEIQRVALEALDKIRNRSSPAGRAEAASVPSEAPPPPEPEVQEDEEIPVAGPGSAPPIGDDLDMFLDGGGLDSLPPKKPE